MNLVLDVLLLRRPLIRYVSPPVCPVAVSGSGSGVMVEAVYGPSAPTGVKLAGQCNRFVVWDWYSGLECMSLYGVSDSSEMFGAYTLLSECLTPGSVSVRSPGFWYVTAVTPDGQESLPCETVTSSGGAWVSLSPPSISGAVRINVYKNPDITNPDGPFQLVLSAVSNGAFEIDNPAGCFRLQAVTENGVSELSTPVCHSTIPDCCPPQSCALGYVWDEDQCSCVPGVSGIIGPDGTFCVGVPYSSQVEAVGGTSPYNWVLVSGSPPPGVTFHTGLFVGNTAPINGTPTAAGNYSFTVGVTEARGSYMQATFTLDGLGVNEGPALTNGTTDTAYSLQLTTGGGTGPYEFSIPIGSLPSGLNMDLAGLITGSPGFSGSYSFSVRVTDSLGAFCDTAMTLEVDACPAVVSYPSIASWGQTVMIHSAFDPVTRRLWLPNSTGQGGSPFYILGIVDTRTNSFLQYATDSGNLINSIPAGAWNNATGQIVLDSIYRTAIVFGTQYISQFNLDTMDCVNCIPLGVIGYQSNVYQLAYDAARGLIYSGQDNTPLATNVTQCNPVLFGPTGVVHTAAPGHVMSGRAYCPDNDTLYFGNPGNGGTDLNIFHKMDCSSNVFSYNAGPLGLATRVWYLPTVKLLVARVANGPDFDLVFIDPLAGDSVVSTVSAFNPVPNYQEADVNSCSGKVYMSNNNFVYSINPQTGAASAIINTATAHIAWRFDSQGNRLYSVDSDISLITTI